MGESNQPDRRAGSTNSLDLVEPRSAAYARRALASTLRDQAIRLLTPEDFVVFKVLSTREQDLVDAASVLASVGSDLDRAAIALEVDTLAVELADHPVRERWERVLETPP